MYIDDENRRTMDNFLLLLFCFVIFLRLDFACYIVFDIADSQYNVHYEHLNSKIAVLLAKQK